VIGKLTVSYHIKAGDHFEVRAYGEETLVFGIGEDEITSDVTFYAEPPAMVELLSEALTRAQELVDRMHSLHSDASRPGPGARSVKRSVLGAGASTALPGHLMAEGGT
jgi:hypothetical protein